MSPFLRDILIGAVMMIVIDITLPFLFDIVYSMICKLADIFRKDDHE